MMISKNTISKTKKRKEGQRRIRDTQRETFERRGGDGNGNFLSKSSSKSADDDARIRFQNPSRIGKRKKETSFVNETLRTRAYKKKGFIGVPPRSTETTKDPESRPVLARGRVGKACLSVVVLCYVTNRKRRRLLHPMTFF